MTIVLSRHLPISDRCYHWLGHGGPGRCHRPSQNPYVLRAVIKSYYTSIDYNVLRTQFQEHISDSRLLNFLEQYL